ncbi:hypothetical protein SAMN03080615_01350 [Amphritea atlantica]|uniref:Uncharacterized protein n=1 Tax=Amphritea atlantica TaxID=355243 RepID=A0A1H9FN98_9GAMM|nr:hypothetical protein [Amphritea atlantica]SEQ39366.1 hypothetical protein SAMN03080615_01350 [Amphritea atlantica]
MALMTPETPHSNFAFLAEYDPIFQQLANAAERSFSRDPNTTLIKLRQLAEALNLCIHALGASPQPAAAQIRSRRICRGELTADWRA